MRDASRLYQAKENQAGIKKYDELTKLLGDRKLKRDELSESFSEVQGNYISLKNKIRAEEAEIARKLQAEKERLRQAEAEKQKEEEARLALVEKQMIEENVQVKVIKKAENYIKYKLKSPSTVSFENTYCIKVDWSEGSASRKQYLKRPALYQDYIEILEYYPDAVLYYLSGRVNAQNGYGAMLQRNWVCYCYYSPSKSMAGSLYGMIHSY